MGDKVGWAVYEFVDAAFLQQRGIQPSDLPRSSRAKPSITEPLRDCNAPQPEVLSEWLVWNTNFKHLPAKTSMRNGCDVDGCSCKRFKKVGSFGLCKCGHGQCHHGTVLPVMRISQEELRRSVLQSKAEWRVFPVVVISKDRQWIEWKKFVQVRNANARGEIGWVGISLRYYDAMAARENKKPSAGWYIECMEYDAGRIYNQHRLVGGDYVQRDAEWIEQHITTSLEIYSDRCYQQRGHYRHHGHGQRYPRRHHCGH